MLEVKSNHWKKLLFEIRSFKDGDLSLGPQISIDLQSFLETTENLKTTKSSINRMLLEIEDRTRSKNIFEKTSLLNEYFFKIKKFKKTIPQKIEQHHWSVPYIIESKEGANIALALLYNCFIQHLEIPLYFVNLSPRLILKKIEKNKKTVFYNFSEQCSELSEKESLSIIHKSRRLLEHKLQLDTCKITDIFEEYLEQRLASYKAEKAPEKEITISECLLALNDMRTDLFLNIALLKRQLGLHKEAFLAMDRYFNFVEEENVSKDIIEIFHELKKMQESPTPLTLH